MPKSTMSQEGNSAPNRLTSRKFVLAMLAIQSASALVWFAKIDPGVYSAVMIAVIGSYFAANVTQKFKGGSNEPDVQRDA